MPHNPLTGSSNIQEIEQAFNTILGMKPSEFISAYNPKYRSWRKTYLTEMRVVFGVYTIEKFLTLVKDKNPALISNNCRDEFNQLEARYEIESQFADEEDDAGKNSIEQFTDALIAFINKWDHFTENDIAEKKKGYTYFVKANKAEDVAVYYDFQSQYETAMLEKSQQPHYKRILRGYIGKSLFIRDEEEKYNAALLKKAIKDIRPTDAKVQESMLVGDKWDWDTWRRNDCVIAAMIFVANNLAPKFNYRDNDDLRPADRNALSGQEFELTKKVADCLNVQHTIFEDPVLFNLMERLGWEFQDGKTWNNFQPEAGETYIISYATNEAGDQYHTVIVHNREIVDRQNERLYGGATPQPNFADLQLEVWQVKKEGKSALHSSLEETV